MADDFFDPALYDLDDVDLDADPADGDGLFYDDASGTWKNGPPAAAASADEQEALAFFMGT